MTSPIRTLALAAALVALEAAAAPAFAHHSGAMFDRARSMTLEGTFLEEAYTNPHVWISVMARPEGTAEPVVRWDVETVSTGNLTRIGITKDTLKPGDKLKVRINPLRDGRHGGSLMSITTADGVVHGFKEGDADGVVPQ